MAATPATSRIPTATSGKWRSTPTWRRWPDRIGAGPLCRSWALSYNRQARLPGGGDEHEDRAVLPGAGHGAHGPVVDPVHPGPDRGAGPDVRGGLSRESEAAIAVGTADDACA